MNTRSARVYTVFALAYVCAADVGSGLATSVTLIRVSEWGSWENLLQRGAPASSLIFVSWCVIIVGLRFKRYTLKVGLFIYLMAKYCSFPNVLLTR